MPRFKYNDFFPIALIARHFGLSDKISAHRFVKRIAEELDIDIVERHCEGSEGQPVSCVAELDAVRIILHFVRHSTRDHANGPLDYQAVEGGVFYIIQLAPDLDPNRIKFGFTANLPARLAQHKTTAPTCALVRWWPCRKSFERVAIISITSYDAIYGDLQDDILYGGQDDEFKPLSPEVFDGDLELAIERAEEFFETMYIGLVFADH